MVNCQNTGGKTNSLSDGVIRVDVRIIRVAIGVRPMCRLH